MTHIVIRVAKNATIVAAFVVAALAGIASGVLFAYAGDLPQVTALDNYSPSTITRVYSAHQHHDLPKDNSSRYRRANTTTCMGL